MAHLHFYVSDEVEVQIRTKAQQTNLPLSQYLAELVTREVSLKNHWPVDYLELFDAWQGEPQA